MSMVTVIILIVYIAGMGGLGTFLLVNSLKNSQFEAVKSNNSEHFSSRIGFIFSAIGISIGVGAIYKFPMMCVQWGGGAFVIAFIITCAVIVIPIGCIALVLGRRTKESEVGAFTGIAKTPGTVLGWFMSIDQMFLLGYYPSVIALGVIYLFKSTTGITWVNNAETSYVSASNNKVLMFLVIIGLLIIVSIISCKGVSKGVERCCKFMIPAVFVILIVIAIRTLFIPGIVVGINPLELSNILNDGVMFITMPKIFSGIFGGTSFMILFYIALIFTGIASSLSQMESGMSLLVDKSGGLGLSRETAIIIELIVAIIIAYFSTFNTCFNDTIDTLVISLGYPIAALGILIVCGWTVGAKKVRQEWYNPTSTTKLGAWADLLCKYLLPVVMAWFTIKAFVTLF